MPFQEKPGSRKSKCLAEIRPPVVHNAEVTIIPIKLHNLTPYVNNCNYSTPDIVEVRRKTTNIQRAGLHNL